MLLPLSDPGWRRLTTVENSICLDTAVVLWLDMDAHGTWLHMATKPVCEARSATQATCVGYLEMMVKILIQRYSNKI